MHKADRKFMEVAIEEAIEIKNEGDYGIGAVVVKDGEIIARGRN